ncbi:MAG: Gfo/Idh/MocA family oxidoreductase, partial [Candidatus Brockarchaeota archaeon]|nr:Gfo/Idh/MocA family oxidoreductase [Candidatus Brockarchaeota archaeon]
MGNRRVGVCLVGCGFIGSVHAERWRQIPESKLVACVDIEKERAKSFEETYGFQESGDDLDRFLRLDSVDIVDVCTPTYTHKDIVLRCLEHGKHVIVEKPISLKLSDAREMIQRAGDSGLKLMVAHVLRFWGEYVVAKRLITEGAIGEPAVARAYRQSAFPAWAWENWHDHLNKGGGVFVDMSIHDVDFLRWSMGEVEEVYAQGGTYVRKGASSHDYTHALLKFKSGAIAYVEGSWIMPEGYPFTTFLEVAGTGGILQVDNQSTATVSLHTRGRVERFTPFEKDGYYLELQAFLDSVLNDTPPPVSG